MTQILALATTSQPSRSVRDALLLLVPLAVTVWILRPTAFFSTAGFPLDGHARISLEQAINAQFCGLAGQLSSQHPVAAILGSDPRLMDQPLDQVVASSAGSMAIYCRSIDRAFLNNENSLMLLMRAALRLQPHQSAAALGRWLDALRLTLFLLFAYALLEAGAGLPLALGCVLTIFEISRAMKPFDFTIYSFFVADLLGMTAMYVLAWRRVGRWHPAAMVGACFVAGFVTAFFVNMRTSHFPVYATAFLVFLLAACPRKPAIHRYVVAAVWLIAFGLAYVAFGRFFIDPLVPTGDGPHVNYSHHVVAHPLVLALAVPPNPLAQGEGIRWNDEVGLTLARRMVPNAVYLGWGYEEGLLLYYTRLWMQHPAEMRAIYRAKLAQAGTGMFDWERTNQLHNRVSTMLGRIVPVVTGGQILLGYAVVLMLAGWRFFRHRSALGAIFTFLAVAAVLLMLEAAIIASNFLMQYDAYLLLFTAMLLLLGGQLGLDWLWRRLLAHRTTSVPLPASAR